MSDKFIPLVIGTLPPAGPAAEPAKAGLTAATTAASAAPSAPDGCDKPEVVLQRNAAGVVTSIRVQCGCGKVTELNCVY